MELGIIPHLLKGTKVTRHLRLPLRIRLLTSGCARPFGSDLGLWRLGLLLLMIPLRALLHTSTSPTTRLSNPTSFARRHLEDLGPHLLPPPLQRHQSLAKLKDFAHGTLSNSLAGKQSAAENLLAMKRSCRIQTRTRGLQGGGGNDEVARDLSILSDKQLPPLTSEDVFSEGAARRL
jgi:hypothetical protein